MAVGNSRSVVGAGMQLLGAVADSRLQVVVVWHMVPAHSKWPLSAASESQYMTWFIVRLTGNIGNKLFSTARGSCYRTEQYA